MGFSVLSLRPPDPYGRRMGDNGFCASCGTRLPAGVSACPTCGTAVVGAAVAASGGSRGSGALVPVLLGVIGLLVMVLAIVVVRGQDEGSSAGGGEVFLEAAAAPGPDAFTDPADPIAPASTAVAEPVADTKLPPPPPGVVPTSGQVPPPGSPPYGGSGSDKVCDREKLVGFLTAQPERAAAWAGVLGVAVADIPTYIRSLTPTVLLYDTRVTNHGFAGGRATPRQSVLQAGTAVLVDANGDPVVRCRCGNPLRPPATVPKPKPVGTPWPGYQPTALVSVSVGVTVTVTLSGAPETGSPSTSAPATTSSTTASTTASTTTPGGGGPSPTVNPAMTDADRNQVEGLVAVVSECTNFGPLQVLDVQPLEGVPGTYTATLDVGGTVMQFTYTPESGTIGEGDRASAQLLDSCGVQR